MKRTPLFLLKRATLVALVVGLALTFLFGCADKRESKAVLDSIDYVAHRQALTKSIAQESSVVPAIAGTNSTAAIREAFGLSALQMRDHYRANGTMQVDFFFSPNAPLEQLEVARRLVLGCFLHGAGVRDAPADGNDASQAVSNHTEQDANDNEGNQEQEQCILAFCSSAEEGTRAICRLFVGEAFALQYTFELDASGQPVALRFENAQPYLELRGCEQSVHDRFATVVRADIGGARTTVQSSLLGSSLLLQVRIDREVEASLLPNWKASIEQSLVPFALCRDGSQYPMFVIQLFNGSALYHQEVYVNNRFGGWYEFDWMNPPS